jgi:uncharacterized protein YjiS (DUF1127 family)
MEIVMSMNWTVPFSAQAGSGAGWLRSLAAAAERRWIAFCQWRLEQIAIAQLNAMSDHDLKDIGLIRSEVDGAVRFAPAGGVTPDRSGDEAQTKWRGVIQRRAA